jgi:hypothetical protein
MPAGGWAGKMNSAMNCAWKAPFGIGTRLIFQCILPRSHQPPGASPLG